LTPNDILHAVSVRERIVDAASAGFVRDGVLATRLDDIRREAGVSVGAVYHHFPDKETLHADVWLLALAGYQQGFLAVLADGHGAEQGVREVVRHHVRFTVRNPDRAALLRGRDCAL
jgi:AcrR family transcriptional regulator